MSSGNGKKVVFVVGAVACITLVAGYLMLRSSSAPAVKQSTGSEIAATEPSNPILPLKELDGRAFGRGKAQAGTTPLTEMPEKEKQLLKKNGVLFNVNRPLEALSRDNSVILLKNAIIDTSIIKKGGPSIDIPEGFRAPADTKHFIVQFKGPITQQDRQALTDEGAVIETYIPNFAYTVTAGEKAIKAIRQKNIVNFVEPYHPYFKMSDDVRSYLLGSADEKTKETVEKGMYNLLLFSDTDTVSALKKLGAEVNMAKTGGDFRMARVECKPQLLDRIVKTEGVRWVEAQLPKKLMNDLANITTRALPTRFSFSGLDGRGVTVAVHDTGVDYTHEGFSIDPTQPTTTNINSRIVYYEAHPGGYITDGLPGDIVGHGTHVSGSILGNGARSVTVNLAPGSGSPPYSTNEFCGMAPGASLVMLEDFSSFTSEDLALVSYRHGARLSNNSWGGGNPFYNAESALWDRLVRDADPDAIGNQEFSHFFAAANNGNGDNDGYNGIAGTVGWPGNAKNVVTVGALEQRRNANNLPQYGSIIGTDSDWQQSWFSSRGPTPDGRFKPDVCAPGSYVLSCQSAQVDPSPDELVPVNQFDPYDFRNGNVDTGPKYMLMSGTSMATPVTTGCGTLIYQYYMQAFQVPPTPALLRAMLISGANPSLSYTYDEAPWELDPFAGLPAPPQIVNNGWGKVDVVTSIRGAGCRATDEIKFYNGVDVVETTGSIVTKNYLVADDDAGGLKVTIAWTDYAGDPAAGRALVNDLDLIVTAPNGKVYMGNVFGRRGWGWCSYALDAYDVLLGDPVNNVEQVIIRHAMKGVYKIEISGYNVPVVNQDVAVVISKGVSTIGDSGGVEPALAMDGNNFPVMATAIRCTGVPTDKNVTGVRRWVGPYGVATEFNTWRHFRNQWFDYGSNVNSEAISGFIDIDQVSEPDLAINPDNGQIFCTWVYHNFDTSKPDVIYLKRWDGTNWSGLGSSYQTQYGICSNGIQMGASSPRVCVGADGNPIVAYIQNRLDYTAMDFYMEVVVKRWSGTNWALVGTQSAVALGSFAFKLDMTMVGGQPVVVWNDAKSGNLAIKCYRFNGTTWSQVGSNFGAKPDLGTRPRIATDGSAMYVTWIEYPTPDIIMMNARVAKSSGGAWQGLGAVSNSMDYPVSTTNASAYNPQIACRNGRVYFGWQAGDAAENKILVKQFDGTGWTGVYGSDSNSVVNSDGRLILRDMVVHPIGLPIVAIEVERLGMLGCMVWGLTADFTPPIFQGIETATGTTNATVETTWLPMFGVGMDYLVCQSPISYDPHDTNLTAYLTNSAVIASVFGNVIQVVNDRTSLTISNLTTDRVWFWGVRVRNSAGLQDSNTKILPAGPYSLLGDADGDWLSAQEELSLGTSPVLNDTDRDGMWDGWEFFFSNINTGQFAGIPAHSNALYMNPFDSGHTNVLTRGAGTFLQDPDYDLDDDGLSNLEEFQYWLSRNYPKGAGTNWMVVRTSYTNWLLDPTNPDSDGDGMPDGWEARFGLDPGAPSDGGIDSDGDGVVNSNEYRIGGNPNEPDSDFDDLMDGQEMALGTRADNPDTDCDGLMDGFEVGIGTLPNNADSNGNGVSDGDEYQLGWLTPQNNNVLYTQFLYQNASGWAGWTVGTGGNLWHITTADPDPPATNPVYMTTHSTNRSFRCANDPTRSDTNATYEIAGQLIYSSLTSPQFRPLTNACLNLYVTWKEWYQTEAEWDLCEVVASDDGLNWSLIRPGVSGVSTGWVLQVGDMSRFAASTNVQVRFLFRTLNIINNNYHGWYVDDIRVYAANRVTGTVRDIDGRPIHGAVVMAIGSGGVTNQMNGHRYVLPGKIYGYTGTGADGTYRINGLYRGNYYFKAVYPGYRSEFWNGRLYNDALPYYQAFGSQINAGVMSRWEVGALGRADLTPSNGAVRADFEIERGTSRGSIGVMSSATGHVVYLNQAVTNAYIWNGETNSSNSGFVRYMTKATVTPTHPDWETNNFELTGVRPTLIEDIDEGDHVVYLHPEWPAMPTFGQVLVPVRDGETTIVEVETNYLSGEINVYCITNRIYDIYVDNRPTGKQTTGTDSPKVLSLAQGRHDVVLMPGGSNAWITPKVVTVEPVKRVSVTFGTNDILSSNGWVSLETIDLHNDPMTGATVYVDGMAISSNDVISGVSTTTPVVLKGFKLGNHWVNLMKDGYRAGSRLQMTVYAGVTNWMSLPIYEADRDYDAVGDNFEMIGYTNIFLYCGRDDPDGDAVLNRVEYDVFRLDNIKMNLGKADSDSDAVNDGIELGFDGKSNVLAVSVLYTNASVYATNVDVRFHGRFLEGLNVFNTNLLAVTNGMYISIEGDLFWATNMVWMPDQYLSPVMRFRSPQLGASNRIVSIGHNPNAFVFADMIPDDVDSDGDIMWDGFEYIFLGVGGLNPIEHGAQDADPDHDGLRNLDEFFGFDRTANTNDWSFPNNPDSDGDTIPDGWEFVNYLNPRDPVDALLDPDSDGLINREEWEWNTDPNNPDSDFDGLNDGPEVKIYKTNPLDRDTDRDGLVDGQEVVDTDLDDSNGTDGGFFPNWNGGDMDHDGFVDGPTDWDTDGDGMPDGFEVKDIWGNIRPMGLRLNPSDPTDGLLDYDGDTLNNLQEYLVRDALAGNHPSVFDPAYAGIIWDFSTDPFNPDSDADGMPDGFEAFDGLWPIDPIPVVDPATGLTNQLVRSYYLGKFGDLDLDGVANTNEYSVRFMMNKNAMPYVLQGSTHPWLHDTDYDGLYDGEEFKAFQISPLNQDSDLDGLADGDAIPNVPTEVNAEYGPDLAGDLDFALGDLWAMGSVIGLPYPIWIRATQIGDVPSSRWGAVMVDVRYGVHDHTNGYYVAAHVGGDLVPGEQVLLRTTSKLLFGGRNGVSQFDQTYECSWSNGVNWALRDSLGRPSLPDYGPLAGFSELAAAKNLVVVDETETGYPRNQRRPRPGAPPGYRFYTDDRLAPPIPVWGEGGTTNWDQSIAVCGWIRSGFGANAVYWFQPGRNRLGLPHPPYNSNPYDGGTTYAFLPRYYKCCDDTNITIRFGWSTKSDAYDWLYSPVGTTLAFDNLGSEIPGQGGWLRVGADPTNRVYTGINIGRVMNSRYDCIGIDYTPVVNARLRVRVQNQGAPFNVQLIAELNEMNTFETLPRGYVPTLTSPWQYYTDLGQTSAWRPRVRDRNYIPPPGLPFSPWVWNSTPLNVTIPGTGFDTVETTIDVSAIFTQAMFAAAMGDEWMIGNHLGFLFIGNTNDVGMGWIVENQTRLYVNITTPHYTRAASWYYPFPPIATVQPCMRKSAAMQWSPVLGLFVLFGGVDSCRALDDTWVTPDPFVDWEPIDYSLAKPPPRWGHSMVATDKGVMIFGGFDKNNRPLNDLWELNDTMNWIKVLTADNEIPAPRGGAAMGYLGAGVGGFIYMFGGTDGEKYFNDTWILTMPGMVDTLSVGITNTYGATINATNIFETTTWVNIQPNGQFSAGPAPRAFAASTHNNFSLFGGRCGVIPSGQDSDFDFLDDGREVALGGPVYGRDPRINALIRQSQLVSTNIYNPPATAAAETTQYVYRAVGETAGGPPMIADFEALAFSGANWIYGNVIGLPVEGSLATGTAGFGGYIPSDIMTWWHCFCRTLGNANDPRDVWELGCPRNENAPSNAVPPTAHSGRWCMGTKLDGCYVNDSVIELYSPWVDLSLVAPVTNTFYLLFYEWLDLADENDYVKIDAVRPITPADIVTRVTGQGTNGVPPRPIVTLLPNRNNGYNTTGAWRRVVVPLEPIVNEPNVFFRFTLQSDSNKTAGGWYIDDMAIFQGGRIIGTYTNTSYIYLFGRDGTNPVDQVYASGSGQFEFSPLPAGEYRVIAGDGSGVDVGIAGGYGTWTVILRRLTQNDIVLNIRVNSPAKVSWNADVGVTYEIQYTTGTKILAQDPWTPLARVTATGTLETYTDLDSDTEDNRMYRVIKIGVP